MQEPNNIQAVLFDFDGTLTRPGALDFGRIKTAVGCPSEIPVLEYVQGIGDPARRREAFLLLEKFEMQGALASEPNEGAEEILAYLQERKIPIGILTRNTLKTVTRALENFEHTRISDFKLVVTRDDHLKPKPDPDGIIWAAEKMGVRPEDILMVGDFAFDMQAGERAGAWTVFLDNRGGPEKSAESCFTISRLQELKAILEMGRPLPGGKLPNPFLERVLAQFAFEDPSVIVGPAVGEDTAVVDIQGGKVLVLKSDPVTFARDSIGWYAVLVNANDIATSGAVPRWMLATLLFPVGTSALDVHRVAGDLYKICRHHGIALCGGHIEITQAVRKPVVSGMMAGIVERSSLIQKSRMHPGDVLLLTKGVAVEGTAIIAMEFRERLKGLGLSFGEIALCRGFLHRISILKEARVAAGCPGVSAMHDVTEGGLATAVSELGMAGGCRIRIHQDKIPVFPLTRKICSLLSISPMGLIGSGSLLVCCSRECCDALMADIRKEGIEVTAIGEVLEKGTGVEAVKNGQTSPWPSFAADEITRLF